MNNKILILGETCLDKFVYCDSERLCPDIPVPVLNIKKTITNKGMASNVQANMKSLGINCDIITNKYWKKISKTRFLHEKTNHMFFRVDISHNIPHIDLTHKEMHDIINKYEIIVISDYNKGFLYEDDINFICNNHSNVFIDTKKSLDKWISKAKIIKINNYEFNRSKKSITQKLKDKIIITTGRNGCVFKNQEYKLKNIIDVSDTTGCGDTFMAGLVVKYFLTKNIEEAIIFANNCASTVAKYRGVTVIKYDNINGI